MADSLTREGRGEQERALTVARKSRLTLVPCDAEPRHWKVYGYWREGVDYEPPCMYCCEAMVRTAYEDLQHAHHRAWRRWKWIRTVVHWLGMLGVISGGYGYSWSRTCNYCMTGRLGVRGHRSHVLWVRTSTWGCLRRRHIPGEEIGFGLCTKCAPCPDCGNTTAVYHDCQRQSEASL